MFWLGVCGLCTLGAMVLSNCEGSIVKDDTSKGGSNLKRSEGLKTSSDIKFTREFVRNNLESWYYDNWQCEEIAYQLRDVWLTQEANQMLRRGYLFYEIIEEFRANGKLNI